MCIQKVNVGLVLISLFFLSISCSKNTDSELNPGSTSDDYFPLETGNYWQWQYFPKIEVIQTKELAGKIYFAMASVNDTVYYRKENNKVYSRTKNTNEALVFDLGAKVNDTWISNSYTVKLVSKTDSIRIGNTLYTHCYSFFFDIPQIADEEYMIWLAPGIGYIQKMCECVHPVVKLEEAMIHNKRIPNPNI